MLAVCLSVHSKAQSNDTTYVTETEFRGWTIRKSDKLTLGSGATAVVKNIYWTDKDGPEMVYANLDENGFEVKNISLHSWINDGRIKAPESIQLKPIPSASGAARKNEYYIPAKYELDYGLKMAGENLHRYVRIQSTGINLQIAGAALSLAGSTYGAITGEVGGFYAAAGGAVLSFVGWIVSANSHKHIGFAGSYLKGIVPLNTPKNKDNNSDK